jgi:hypothetical protein
MAGRTINHIKHLKPDGKNARRHNPRNIGLIGDALREVGAARSIVIDEAGNILAGNGTIEAAAEAGITKVQVVDADGETIVAVRRRGLSKKQKQRLALYDNRASDLAGWEADILREFETEHLLDGLFYDEEFEALCDQPADLADSHDGDDIDGLPDDAIGGQVSVLGLKNDARFPSSNQWGIPDLLPELLAECPQPIRVWASDKSEPSDYYLAVYQNISQAGLNRENAILSFYTHDAKFEMIWYAPGQIVEKLLAQHWRAIVAPNFSLWAHQPRLIQMWQVFRSRWIGRYLQGAGISVIPDIDWIDDASFEFNLLGIPSNPPCVAIQCQTALANKQEEAQRADGIARIAASLEPKQLLIYGANDEWQSRIAEIVHGQSEIIHVEQLSRRLRRVYKVEKTK